MPYLAALGFLISLVSWEFAQAPYGLPIAHACQAVHTGPGPGAEHNQGPAQPPPTWPVTIDEAEKTSRGSCGTPEQCRAEQREYYDLRAQWQAAEAAKGQESLAFWQTAIAVVTTIVASFGTWLLIRTLKENKRSANAAADAAKAAFEANQINREAMLAEQRPWLSVTYKVGGPLEWTADGGCNLQFIFWLENVGNTPAVRVHFDLETILVPTTDQKGFELRLADRMRNGAHRGREMIVFPRQRIQHNALVMIPKRDLDSAKKQLNCDFIFPNVVGCVEYYSTLGGNGHQTCFTFHVHRIPLDDSVSVAISTTRGNIPAEHLFLVPGVESGRID